MDALDPTEEWRRLAEYYRRLGNEELIALAQQNSELTEAAQQTLSQEISQRGLTVPVTELPPPIPEPEPDSPYAEDRELVQLCIVWSLSDALQLQRLLDVAGIPFFLGPEKATGVDAVTSNFAEGVSVQVMRIGLAWTHQLMTQYHPADDPDSTDGGELEDDLAIRCPKCHSTEVIFESLSAESDEGALSQYKWFCDSCGHTWQDEGIVGSGAV